MSEKTGILSMPAEQYRLAAGTSKSDLDHIAPPNTPAHFRAYKLGEMEKEESEAMRIGSLVHRRILEPDTMENAFHIRPDNLDQRTKDGKKWVLEHSDKPVISQKDHDRMERMRDNVWGHPVAKRLLYGARTEASLFEYDDKGTLRKGRLDVLPSLGNILPDLKTAECAYWPEFEKSIFNYRYYVQAAYYLDLAELCGITKEAFAFIVVEKNSPFCVAVYQLDPDIVQAGRLAYQRDLDVYRRCMETGNWYGYPETISLIAVPDWARKQIEQVI